jgi:hypothetical protein
MPAGRLAEVVDQICRRQIDPYSAAAGLLAAL